MTRHFIAALVMWLTTSIVHAAAPQTNDACALISVRDLESILGEPFERGTPGTATNQTTCMFRSKTRKLIVVSLFNPSPMNADERWQGMKSNLSKMGELKTIESLGDDAVYLDKIATIFVRTGERIATVNLVGNSAIAVSEKMAVAERIARKFK
jgi:hypothetical protein